MTKGNARRVRIEHIPFRNLLVDEPVQRTLIPARVRHLKRVWDLGKVGTMTASQREDGFYLVNGQHRWVAAMQLGLGDTKARCEVYQGLTREDEAALFLALNDVRLVSTFDKFKVGVEAGHPVAVGTREIVESLGLRVGTGGNTDGTVTCVAQIMKLYEKDPKLLRDTLAIALEAWGTRPTSTEHVVLAGLATVLGRYNGEIDRGAFVKKLSKYPGGAAGVISHARTLADLRPISVKRAAAEVIRDIYNRGRRNELAAL